VHFTFFFILTNCPTNKVKKKYYKNTTNNKTNKKTHANYDRGAQNFQRYRHNLKIQGACKMTLHTEGPQIGLLVANVQNLVAQATWLQGFEHPWNRVTQGVTQPNGIFSAKTRMTSEWLYGGEGLMDTTISLFHTVSF